MEASEFIKLVGTGKIVPTPLDFAIPAMAMYEAQSSMAIEHEAKFKTFTQCANEMCKKFIIDCTQKVA